MKFVSAIPLLSLVFAQALSAAVRVTPEAEPSKAVCVENELVRLVVDPERGGMVVSFQDKRTGRDIIQRSRKYMGLFLDHFWGQNWPGELLESPYQLTVRASGPEEAILVLTRTISGTWQANEQPFLKDLLLEKTIALRDGSDVLRCHIRVQNPTAQARLPAYWCQNVFFIGGDYDAAKDVFFRPSARGVRPSFQGGPQDDFVRDPFAGWSAAVDTAKKDALVFLMDYNDLDMLYDCGGNATLEWMFDKIPVPAGRTWETESLVVPCNGVSSIAHASRHLLAAASVKRQGSALEIEHQLRGTLGPVTGLTLTVRTVGAIDRTETRAHPLTVGPVGTDWQTVKQSVDVSAGDPVALHVTASGTAGGEAFSEEYILFYAGSYGYGDNVQQDMSTPLYKVARPEKKQQLMRPEKLVRERLAQPQLFVMQGMHTDVFQIDAAARKLGAATRVGTYSLGLEGPRISDFPFDYDALFRQDVVIAANVNLECLGKLGLLILRDYLTHGGSLFLLGGKSAYGAGGLSGSGLDDILPVVPAADAFDIERVAAPVPTASGKTELLKAGTWGKPLTHPLYLHRVTVKPGADTLLTANGKPVLVVRELPGGGRIACLLAAPYGDSSEGPHPLFGTTWWPDVVADLLTWLARR